MAKMKMRLTPDDGGPPYEHCCFCFKTAKHWYAPKDVAVCIECAETHEPAEVPNKEEWCAAVVKRYPEFSKAGA